MKCISNESERITIVVLEPTENTPGIQVKYCKDEKCGVCKHTRKTMKKMKENDQV